MGDVKLEESKIMCVYLSLSGITYREYRYLISRGISVEDIYNKKYNLEELNKLIPYINIYKVKQLLSKEIMLKLDYYVNIIQKCNICVIPFDEENYPNDLIHMFFAPICIYTKGDNSLLNSFKLGVMCKKWSTYSNKVERKLMLETLNNGTEDNIKFVDICGKSVNIFVENNIHKLVEMKSTKENLCVCLSLKIPSTINGKINDGEVDLISSIIQGLVIIEAEYRKDIINIVDNVLEQGKSICCVPGNVFNTYSYLSNYLIKNGAKLITNIQDIYEEYTEKYYQTKRKEVTKY